MECQQLLTSRPVVRSSWQQSGRRPAPGEDRRQTSVLRCALHCYRVVGMSALLEQAFALFPDLKRLTQGLGHIRHTKPFLG